MWDFLADNLGRPAQDIYDYLRENGIYVIFIPIGIITYFILRWRGII